MEMFDCNPCPPFKVEVKEATGGPKEKDTTDVAKPKEKKEEVEVVTREMLDVALAFHTGSMKDLRTFLTGQLKDVESKWDTTISKFGEKSLAMVKFLKTKMSNQMIAIQLFRLLFWN